MCGRQAGSYENAEIHTFPQPLGRCSHIMVNPTRPQYKIKTFCLQPVQKCDMISKLMQS